MKQKTERINASPDKSVDTDIHSQQRTQRKHEIEGWSEDQIHKIAAEENVEITQAHLQVISILQKYYIKHGLANNGRELDALLDDVFSEQGGRKYLHRLFPEGPVTQGMRFAGLSVPAHSEDGGFGTTR